MKKTAIAPSNIAFIKYWGRKDELLRLPMNASISMNLSNLLTTTTVEFDNKYKEDIVIINRKQETEERLRVIKHLNRIRASAHMYTRAKVVSENNFPASTGLSSSASGFAALTLAGIFAAGISFSEKEISILARQGSGSACRSIPDGFVEWTNGETSKTSYAVSLYNSMYWDIIDIIAITDTGKKEVTTTEGHMKATSSPFFKTRLSQLKRKILLLKEYIKQKNFKGFGELIEQEALELHAIYLTSLPPLFYLRPESFLIIQSVIKWRQGGLPVYFSLNTGQDVHVFCEGKYAQQVEKLLKGIKAVKKTITNSPANGARLIENHLF
jgi:diphosphomevalonate decarboxylase